ncbi:MAG: hypothetical protein QOI06_1159 [Nocardioidaceae bacterium]|jgi:peptidoglycan/LPS O-acetylase OafA/YrhL|nr:hypothetical protein [Nocardioidaceae bacterium]
MARLVRISLLVAIAFFLLAGVVVGIGADTGPFEKVVLAGLGALLVLAAAKVRRFGRPRSAQ